MKNTSELLKDLTQITCVSGYEKNIHNYLINVLKDYGEVTTDAMNNIFCTFGSGVHFLLDAHIDQIGFIVTEITDDGFMKFDKIGGIDAKFLPAFEVTVWGKKKISGVISTLPPHLQSSDDEKKAPKIRDLAIDTGYSKAELDEIISVGDTVTFKNNFTQLLNNQVSANSLDDRSGVAAILLCLDRLKKLPCKITVLFSSQEEVGTRGAKIGPYLKKVDESICVDVSFAYTPGCDKIECGEISKGAMIGFSPILNRDISNKLASVAKDNNIPYQREIMSGRTGTNADVISISESGVKTALISIPEKYMHQRVEVVDTADVEAVSDLICAYIKERSSLNNA